MVQKPNRKSKYDAIKMRMDLTFDVPAELAEQIELWGICQFERCVYEEECRQLCLSACTTLYRKGA